MVGRLLIARVLDDGLVLASYALVAGRILGFCLGWGLVMAGAELHRDILSVRWSVHIWACSPY